MTNPVLSGAGLGRTIAIVEVADARALARRLLADDLPRRWDHVQGVAKRAQLFVDLVPQWNALASAAYLHDIGYASELVDTGFHQLDGARYLRRQGWDESVVNLVAHHSGAQIRADLIGLGEIYTAEFPRDDSLPHRQLYFCDMTVALDGSPTTAEERLADMRNRHRNNPSMLEYLDIREDDLIALVSATWAELDQSGGTPSGQTLSAT